MQLIKAAQNKCVVIILSIISLMPSSSYAEWVQAKQGIIPQGAFQAVNQGGQIKYFARIREVYNVFRGKQSARYHFGYIVRGEQKAVIIWTNTMIITRHSIYEVLVEQANSLKWVSTRCNNYFRTQDQVKFYKDIIDYNNVYMGRGSIHANNGEVHLFPGSFKTIQIGLQMTDSQSIASSTDFQVLICRLNTHQQMATQYSIMQNQKDQMQREKLTWLIVSCMFIPLTVIMLVLVIILSCILSSKIKKIEQQMIS